MAAADKHWHYGETLKRCQSYLTNEYIIRPLVQELVNDMCDNGHISYGQGQDLQETVITRDKMRNLIAILISKSEKTSYDFLIKTVAGTGHLGIVDKLHNEMKTVSSLLKPPEEKVHEMAKRIKENLMNVPMSEISRCLSIVAGEVTADDNADDTQGGDTAITSANVQLPANPTLQSRTEDTDESSYTRLKAACIDGDVKAVSKILSKSPNCVNIIGSDGMTPLMTACCHAKVHIVIELLKCDSLDANVKDENGRTALMHSVLLGNTDVLAVLLNSGKVRQSVCDNDGLRYMSYIFGIDIVKYLSILGLLMTNAKDELEKSAIYELHFLRYTSKIKKLQNRLREREQIKNVVKYLLSNNNVDATQLLKSCMTTCDSELLLMILESADVEMDNRDINDYSYAIATSINPGLLPVLIEYGMIDLCKLSTVQIETLVESVLRHNSCPISAQTSKLIYGLKVNSALCTALRIQSIPPAILNATLDRSIFNLNAKDRCGNSVFGLLCKYAGYEMVSELIQRKNVEFSGRNDNEQTCLMLSLMNDDKRVAKLFLDNSTDIAVDVNDVDKFHTSTLMYACEANNIEVMTCLVTSGIIDINVTDDLGHSALTYVCLQGKEFTLSMVKRHACSLSIDVEDKTRNTVMKQINRMSSLYTRSSSTEIAGILLDAGASLVCGRDVSMLTYACIGGNAAIVSQLIDKGMDVNAETADGCTALTPACIFGNSDIVRLLLMAGASVGTLNNDGRTELYWACSAGDIETVKHLLEAGANVNIAVSTGGTALLAACRCGDADIVRLLLRANADVNATDSCGNTPLMKACLHDDDILLKQLLSVDDININCTNNNGKSALSEACYHGSKTAVCLLLEHNADTSLIVDGLPLITMTKLRGHAQIANILVKKRNVRFSYKTFIVVTMIPLLTFLFLYIHYDSVLYSQVFHEVKLLFETKLLNFTHNFNYEG